MGQVSKSGVAPWKGKGVTEARKFLEANTVWPVACGKCGKPVPKDPPGTDGRQSGWRLGHKMSRSTHPELTWVKSNWQVEHRKCSDKSGQAQVIENAKREALKSVGVDTKKIDDVQKVSADHTVFSHQNTPGQSPPLLLSLSEDDEEEPMVVRDDLSWNPDYLRQFDWLRDLADVPADASPPRLMSPVPADAVGTYGWEMVKWIEKTQKIKLRWWQKLSNVRQLEHREDGTLCFETKVESAPRRSGKSVNLRGGALWRMEYGEAFFGEVQTIIHTGSDMAICREIQRGAWKWAEENGWTVTRGNGKEAIESPDEARWLVRAQDAVYGYDATQALVDEGWNVKPDTVSEGLEPAMLERESPQLVATSTAHRRATSLMRTLLKDAMTTNDPTVLLLLWGAPENANPGDQQVWRDASPYWSESRRKLIARKYEKALAGEDDPEFDDPDPMEGFKAQYLNIWKVNEIRTVGNAIIEKKDWAAMATDQIPSEASDSIAVESWFAEGVSVVRAWKPAEGPIKVSVSTYPDLPTAAAQIATYGFRRAVLVGASLAEHPAWKAHNIRVQKSTGSTRAAVGDAIRLLGERAFVHDGGEALTRQVLDLRTSPGVDGPRIRSTGRADALKALVWAVQEASQKKKGMVLPSRERFERM